MYLSHLLFEAISFGKAKIVFQFNSALDMAAVPQIFAGELLQFLFFEANRNACNTIAKREKSPKCHKKSAKKIFSTAGGEDGKRFLV